MSQITSRKSLLADMAAGQSLDWDVIIVGGGITGAGVLREAVRRGYRALLVEQQDFSWGTSSRSSKMVHGGLRYLAAGDIKLTKHSLEERERLLHEAPGLVDRIAFYFALGKGNFPGRLAMTVILTIYDFLARIRDHRYCKNAALKVRFPGVETKNLKGACYYTDAMVDDSRLVLRVLQESIAAGGQALNYCKVSKLLLNENQVSGVVMEGLEHGSTLELSASVVINATGAWADNLRNQLNPEKRVRPLRGSHLIIPKNFCPVSDVLTSLHPEDKRGVYVYPWEGTTVVGTTDLDHDEDLDIEASISEQETQYLLDGLNALFPQKPLSRSDVISTWAGVRPVIGSENNKDPSRERRDHATWSDNGLITVSGGKLTTFRLIALDAIEAAADRLPLAKVFTEDRVFTEPSISAESLQPKNPVWAQRLLGRYGDTAQTMLAKARPEEKLCIGDTEFCLAECRWAARHESVQHLDDLLLRRTRLGMCLPEGGAELFTPLKEICMTELGWDNTQWQSELTRYQDIWQRFYYFPESSI
ncbi:MAG: glycerol-3-phosphate dehydrogenase/oxidase [Porticoccaceae bacterium]|nr:glycerol-3-phosphate dehydrogenase/oxidase [Porticoccaceae bacterium]